MLLDDDCVGFAGLDHEQKPKAEQSSLQKWVKHLGNLVKEEQRKVRRLSYSPCL